MKRVFLFFIHWLILGGISIAQQGLDHRQGYAATMNQEDARRQLTVLTSPEFAGRGTGAIGARKTADYLKAQFESMGLRGPVNGSFFQPVELVETGFEIREFELGGITLAQGNGFYLQSNQSLARLDVDQVVLVAENSDLSAANLEGKVVLVINGSGEMDYARLQALVGHRPALLLVVSDESFATVNGSRGRSSRIRVLLAEDFEAGGNEAAPRTTAVAVAYLTEAMADRVLAKSRHTVASLRKNKHSVKDRRTTGRKGTSLNMLPLRLRAEFGVSARRFADDNVLGYLPGSDPSKRDEVIVIMAHYDHDGIGTDGQLYAGADDNGSGTVGLLQMARAFREAARAGHGPKRSLLFIGLCAEERGLLGSDYYTRHPIFPLENTVAALNMDMIGRIDDKHLNGNHNYIHVIGADRLSRALHEIVVQANADYTQMELDTTYNRTEDPQRLYYRSDHYNFAKHDIPSVFFFSGLHPHYHTPEDTIEKIDFDLLVKRAQLVFYTAWELANRAERIEVDN